MAVVFPEPASPIIMNQGRAYKGSPRFLKLGTAQDIDRFLPSLLEIAEPALFLAGRAADGCVVVLDNPLDELLLASPEKPLFQKERG